MIDFLLLHGVFYTILVYVCYQGNAGCCSLEFDELEVLFVKLKSDGSLVAFEATISDALVDIWQEQPFRFFF